MLVFKTAEARNNWAFLETKGRFPFFSPPHVQQISNSEWKVLIMSSFDTPAVSEVIGRLAPLGGASYSEMQEASFCFSFLSAEEEEEEETLNTFSSKNKLNAHHD